MAASETELTRRETAPTLRIGGAALALGALGVIATSAFYALSPPAAALPAQPLRLAEALHGAVAGATTMGAAGTIGIFADVAMAVGGALIAAAANRRAEALASAGWAAIAVAALLFTFVDATVGFVLSPLAAAENGAAAFLGFKRLFDALFLLATVVFGAGAALALSNELNTSSLAIGKTLSTIGVAAGLAGLAAALAGFAGLPVEQGVGASVAAGAVVFALIGWRLARTRPPRGEAY